MQVGWLKSTTSDKYPAISRKRYKIDTVSIKVEWEVVCALSNGDIAVHLECPLTTPFSAFRTAILSFVTDEPRDFRFGTLTYHSKSYPADEKNIP